MLCCNSPSNYPQFTSNRVVIQACWAPLKLRCKHAKAAHSFTAPRSATAADSSAGGCQSDRRSPQVIPTPSHLLDHISPISSPFVSRFLRVFTASPRRFQRATSQNPGPRNSRHGCPNSRKHRFGGRANSGCSERMVEPRSAMEVGLKTIVAIHLKLC